MNENNWKFSLRSKLENAEIFLNILILINFSILNALV